MSKLNDSWSKYIDSTTNREWESFCRAYHSEEENDNENNKNVSVNSFRTIEETDSEENVENQEKPVDTNSKEMLPREKSSFSPENFKYVPTQKYLPTNIPTSDSDSEKDPIIPLTFSKSKNTPPTSKQESSSEDGLMKFYQEHYNEYYQDKEAPKFDESDNDIFEQVEKSSQTSNLFNTPKVTQKRYRKVLTKKPSKKEEIISIESTKSEEDEEDRRFKSDKSVSIKTNKKIEVIESSTDSEAEMNRILPGSKKRRSNSGNNKKRSKRINRDNNFNDSQAEIDDDGGGLSSDEDEFDLSVHKSDEEFLNNETQLETNTQMMVYHKKDIFEPSQHPIDAFNSKRKVQGYDREIDTSDEEDQYNNENSYLDDSFINDKSMLTQDISRLEVTPPPAFTQGPVKTRRQRIIKTLRLKEINKKFNSDQVQNQKSKSSTTTKTSSKGKSRRIVKFNSSSEEED